jgi:hypothetical protein
MAYKASIEERLAAVKEFQASGSPASDLYKIRYYFEEFRSDVAFDGTDPESANLDYLCANGYLQAVYFELNRDHDKVDQGLLTHALSAMTTVALSDRNAAKVVDSKVAIPLIQYIKKFAPESNAARALTVVTNLALHSVSHKQLKEQNILPSAVDFLKYLPSAVVDEIDFGLTSASLICRLVGYEESGPGPEAIRSNTKLIDKMQWLLKAVLDAGLYGTVIGLVNYLKCVY